MGAKRIDRRAAVLGGAGLVASVATGAGASVDPLSGAALYADVKTYADLGEHRTGTACDAATTDWLLKSLRAAGYAAEPQGFDYPVFELSRADLTLGGRTLESFPYWTPRTTPPGGVTAPISTTGGPTRIALVTLAAGAGGGLGAQPPVEVTAAAASGAEAVVVITENPLGQLAALNRNSMAKAWPVPVLLAAARDGPALRVAAEHGDPLTVRLEGRTLTRRADNVVARRERPGKPIVVSTPKSGWFHCAGERGSGVAIWLGLARWLATTDRNIILLAASGHEFDGYGGRLFTETLAPKPADTQLWVAIGANVAAYDFALIDGAITRKAGPPSGRILACSASLTARAASAFAVQSGFETPSDIEKSRPPGEVAHFQALGYSPLAGIVGGHPLHHTRRDLPDVTGPQMLEPVARGLAALITASA